MTPTASADHAVELMDQAGVTTAALSLSSPGVAFLASGPERSALARAVNEAGAEAVRRHPGRFALLATLPLPSIESAMSELDHAVDDLGAVGVALHTHVDGVYWPRPRPARAPLSHDRVRPATLRWTSMKPSLPSLRAAAPSPARTRHPCCPLMLYATTKGPQR